MAASTNKKSSVQYIASDEEDSSAECPLCLEPLDIDDVNFYPCVCGYQICRFCWHRIRTDENSSCPQCRKPYEENPAAFKPVSEGELIKVKGRKQRGKKNATESAITNGTTTVNGGKVTAGTPVNSAALDSQQQQQQKGKKQRPAVESRKAFADLRVVQKNLVFVIGLPNRLANADALRRTEIFGQFGKIVKVVVSHNTAYAGSQPSASAYITYQRPEDAMKAIWEVNNKLASIALPSDAHKLRCSLGTTKYCSQFLKGASCSKPDCMYLHEVGDPQASFTKEQMQQGVHTHYEQELVESYKRSLTVTVSTPKSSSMPASASVTAKVVDGLTVTTSVSVFQSTEDSNTPHNVPLSCIQSSSTYRDVIPAAPHSGSSEHSAHSTASSASSGNEKVTGKSKTGKKVSEETSSVVKTSVSSSSSSGTRKARNGQKANSNRQSQSSPTASIPIQAVTDELASCTVDVRGTATSEVPTSLPSPPHPLTGAIDGTAGSGGLDSETNLIATGFQSAQSDASTTAFNNWSDRVTNTPIVPDHHNLQNVALAPTSASLIMQQLLATAATGTSPRITPAAGAASRPDGSNYLRDGDSSLQTSAAGNRNPIGGGSLLQAIINSSRTAADYLKQQQQQQRPTFAQQPAQAPASYWHARSNGVGVNSTDDKFMALRSAGPSVWSADIEMQLARGVHAPNGQGSDPAEAHTLPLHSTAPSWGTGTHAAMAANPNAPAGYAYSKVFDEQIPIGSRLLNTAGLFEAGTPDGASQPATRITNAAYLNGWN